MVWRTESDVERRVNFANTKSEKAILNARGGSPRKGHNVLPFQLEARILNSRKLSVWKGFNLNNLKEHSRKQFALISAELRVTR